MEFIKKIEGALVPDYYNDCVKVYEPIQLLLLRKNTSARYALVVKSISKINDLGAEISSLRDEVRKLTKSCWMIKEIGVYVVLRVPELPNLRPEDIKIDKTGFHAVIIQGIHFISYSGEHLFNHSQWLNHTFGAAESISEKIVAINF